MTRKMADSIDVNALPVDVDIWAMYVNGKWPTFNMPPRKLPPGKTIRVLTISIDAETYAGAYDVERYDLKPENVPRALQTNPHATIYASIDMWQQVKNVCAENGLKLPPWWAAVPGFHALYPGSIATQYETIDGYDLSVVADYWPGFDIPQATQPQGDTTMPYVAEETPGTRQYLIDGNTKLYIPDGQPDSANLINRFGQPVLLSPQFLATIPDAK